MHSWHVIQEVIVKSKNEIIRVEDEIVTLPSLALKIPDSKNVHPRSRQFSMK